MKNNNSSAPLNFGKQLATAEDAMWSPPRKGVYQRVIIMMVYPGILQQCFIEQEIHIMVL